MVNARLFNLTFGAWQDKDSMEAFAWTDVPQHSVSLLRMLMAKFGWIEQGPFNWTHSGLEEGIALNKVIESTKELTKDKIKSLKQKYAHTIRESFRFWHWNKFWATSKRHDAEELRSKGVDTKYPAARLQQGARALQDQEKAVVGAANTYKTITRKFRAFVLELSKILKAFNS